MINIYEYVRVIMISWFIHYIFFTHHIIRKSVVNRTFVIKYVWFIKNYFYGIYKFILKMYQMYIILTFYSFANACFSFCSTCSITLINGCASSSCTLFNAFATLHLNS